MPGRSWMDGGPAPQASRWPNGWLLSNFEGRLPLLRRYIDLARCAANLKRLDHVARIIARQIDKGNYDWALVHNIDPMERERVLAICRGTTARLLIVPNIVGALNDIVLEKPTRGK